MSDSLPPHELYSSWNSPGLNTGIGRLSLLQEIFPTQDSNQGLLHFRQILHQLSYQGSHQFSSVAQSCPTLCHPMDYIVHGIFQARILEWAAIPFSRGSSQSRDRNQVSCIAGRFFTSHQEKVGDSKKTNLAQNISASSHSSCCNCFRVEMSSCV